MVLCNVLDVIRAPSPSSSSVRTEDTLDEDVRRILNKYSKVLTSSEDESDAQPTRKSPQGRDCKDFKHC